MSILKPFIRCDGGNSSLVFDLRRGSAELASIGPALPFDENLAAMCDARLRGSHQSQPNVPEPSSILPQSGWGYGGTPAVILCQDGQAIPSRFVLSGAVESVSKLNFTFEDSASGATLEVCWSILESGVIKSEICLTNNGQEPFELVSLASLALPLTSWARWAVRYSGRWAAEMQKQRHEIGPTGLSSTSYGGRPGFGGGNWVRIESANASEDHGHVIAAHLAWSGDHQLLVERNADGEAMLMMAARLELGEIELKPGQVWRAPHCIMAVSGNGIVATRHAFHSHCNADILPAVGASPRKVHLNTWEALGFGLDQGKLNNLADAAAALGVERFVLDDGWFKGRRDDTSGLGDWVPDAGLFPEGLTPIIEHVESLGMDFGLWVEPEMISPDSDLYREHPDWCIHVAGQPRLTQRSQLVLDLTRMEVTDYLFSMLDSLLRDNRIAYLKWDHNRDLFPPAGKEREQVVALYALLDRLRLAHPHVEIETCASGGGRVDFAMLERCTRFWASDNNDAIDRLKINAGWFDFLPLRAVGNHVGPSPNPITGRQISMDFRAKVAMFGHMGIEADPGAMSEDDRKNLTAHIAIYKQWRDALHSGKLTVVGCNDPGIYGWFVWAKNRGIALVAQTIHAQNFEVPPVRLTGLEPLQRYKIKLIEPWPELAARRLANPDRWRDGMVLSGQVLAVAGLALPLTLPETAWLISVELAN